MIASEGGQGSAGQDPVEPLSLSLAPASRRRAFRIWRRSRPFWGGLLLLLAGLEMLAIPLLSVLAHTSVKVIIYIGIGGVFGVLIGGLLVAWRAADLVSPVAAGLLCDRRSAPRRRVLRRDESGRVLRRHAARRDWRIAELRLGAGRGTGAGRPAASATAPRRPIGRPGHRAPGPGGRPHRTGRPSPRG